MAIFFRRNYPVGSFGGYVFSFAAGDDRDGVSPRTTHLTSQNSYCFNDGGDFLIVSK